MENSVIQQQSGATSIALPMQDDAGIHAIRQGYNMLAQGVGTGIDNVQRQIQEDNRTHVAKQATQDNLEWDARMKQYMQDAPPGAEGFIPGVMQDFDEYAKDKIESMPQGYARNLYQQHVDQLRNTVGQQALQFSTQAKIADRINTTTNMADANAQLVAQDPSRYQELLDQFQRSISDVGPEQTTKLHDYGVKKLNEAWVMGMVKSNPQAAASLLNPTAKNSGISSPVDNMSLDERAKYYKLAAAQADVDNTKSVALSTALQLQGQYSDLSEQEKALNSQFSDGKLTAEAHSAALQLLRADFAQQKSMESERDNNVLAEAIRTKMANPNATIANMSTGSLGYAKTRGSLLKQINDVFAGSGESQQLTPDSARLVDRIKGMAVTDPVGLSNLDVGSLVGRIPNGEVQAIINLKANIDKNASRSDMLHKQMVDPLVRAQLDAARVTIPGKPPKGDDYNEFAGQFAPAVEQFMADNKRAPSSQELGQIAARLTAKVPVKGWLWNSNKPSFLVKPDDKVVLPTPKTQADYNRLSKGSKYIDPNDGKTYIKQ